MSRSLVVGAGGQIGSDLVPALVRRGDEVRMMDLRPARDCSAYPALAAFFAADPRWTDRWIVGDAAKGSTLPDLIRDFRPREIHLLTALLSATGEEKPGLCWDVNMGSLRLVLETCAALPAAERPRVVWPSSIAAFGPIPGLAGGLPDPVPDPAPLWPTTMYGVTKVAGELLGGWYAATGRCDFRAVRFPGLLNATPPGGGTTDFANEMIFAAVEERPSADFLRPDTRLPFLHMEDAVRALLDLGAADPKRLSRRTYNLAGIRPSFRADALAKAVDAEVRKRSGGARGFEGAFRVDPKRQGYADSWPKDIDDAPARRDWGWKPRVDTLPLLVSRLLDEVAEVKSLARRAT
jgi:threonine 3-dehydrogenase